MGGEGVDGEGERPAALGGVARGQVDEPDQRDHRPDEAVDPELDRGHPALVAAPDRDDQEQRHQRELVADVEEDDVAREEREHHRRLHEEELRVEAALARRDRAEAHQHAARDEHRRQQDEEHADRVRAEQELHAEGAEELPPLLVGPEVAGAPCGELARHRDRDAERHEARHEADRLGGALRAGEAEQGARERDEDEQDGERHEAPPESQIHTTQATISPIPPAMVSA